MGWLKVKPVWGTIKPSTVTGYKVVVVPKSYYETCWDFLVLLPTGGEEEEDIVTVRQMCEIALNNGDNFSIYRMVTEESDDYHDLPVMWLGPDGDDPSWLTPPNAMFN